MGRETAVVTGANSGIGRATAIHLASNGFRVFGTVRSLDKTAKAQSMADEAGVEIEWIELDIADDEDAGDVIGVGGNHPAVTLGSFCALILQWR